MLQLIGAFQNGFIYALLALGVFITFRILNTPDLTADGSFTLGMAVSAVLTAAGHPFAGLLAAALCGALAGSVTGVLQARFGVYPILAGILTMSGLYSVNMFVLGGTPNLSVNTTLFKLSYTLIPDITRQGRSIMAMAVAFAACLLLVVFLIWLFKTHIGLCIRAVGNNEEMVRSSSINAANVKVLALALANACVALCGAMVCQLQGFADVNAGTGMVVVGIASVIIGEVAVGRRGVTLGLLSCVLGSVLYRLIYAFAFRTSFLPAYAFKLLSALIVALAMMLPQLKSRFARRAVSDAKEE